MKVGYVAPMSIAAVNGGIRTQALFTIQNIKTMGVEPILLSPWDEIQNHHFDLIHVFGASIENAGIVAQLETMEIPVALSPVFFSNRSALFIKQALKIEKLSALFGRGIRSDFSVKAELCSKADVILPNTPDESRLIEKGLSIPAAKIRMIPNGVEKRFTNTSPRLFEEKYGLKDFVLFVGQAGAPRKNVIKLLEIAPKIDVPIVIIGSFQKNEYGKKCLALAKKAGNVSLIETLSHDSELLASAYAACKVFVLPSQYETPGIAAMEASLAGANIVITGRGGTKDYFGEFAEYINPKSSVSLQTGIENALNAGKTDALKNHILANYTWEIVAEKTFNQYNKLTK